MSDQPRSRIATYCIATYCVVHGMHDGMQCPACARNDVSVLRGLVDDQASDLAVLRERVAGLERRLREAETILLQLTERP